MKQTWWRIIKEEENVDSREEHTTYIHVLSYRDSSRWMIAMQEEMESIYKNGTWDIVNTQGEECCSL